MKSIAFITLLFLAASIHGAQAEGMQTADRRSIGKEVCEGAVSSESTLCQVIKVTDNAYSCSVMLFAIRLSLPSIS
jgi:hypothetical protein